jgi:hypothetical protein
MFFDLPQGAKVDKYLAGMPTTSWLTWTNPRNEYSNAIILAAGGGSGGNGGTSNSGVGAGGSGGFGHIYCPLSLLPDTLYIQVGTGGIGATTSGGLGTAGGTTYINLYPSIATANNLMSCGGATQSATAAVGGIGGGVTINNTLGVAQGYSGSQTNYSGGGSNYSLPTSGNPIYAGAAGATGTIQAGGMTSVSSLYPSIPGVTDAVGFNGFVIWKPFTVFGGGGGSGAKKGGKGIMGSGGGGGSSPNGQGGNGGDGFVIIICY